ncbi:MAG: rRNA (adenine1518-N6/adenine1519-N6)-dimethyltransferase [Bacteroidales bacterium]|jgi:16S rRNA (adenine1518-N6/adenine1519-N6)-dimethyltransferase|nr:rRNA (adenine1518-N6/adenine1519-N6)-dimethyltransferase [Bacteroidales bacterium]
MTVRPKKHLGQHFLHDRNIAEKICQQLEGNAAHIIEIGPGTGVLTQFLLPLYPEKLQLIEVDQESVEYLHHHFPMLNTRIHQADFLKSDLHQFGKGEIAVIGNFPYNISSQIFFRILEHHDAINEVVCMIQKEVAERISSPPGNKSYGILSVLLQAWYDIEYKFTVHEHVFNPPPKVKSAVIRLTRNQTDKLDCDEKCFKIVVKQAFNQRRKTLRNSLRSLLNAEIIQHNYFDKRPEQLSVKDFVNITQLIDASHPAATPSAEGF